MELVHFDVWSPCRVESVLGFRYFIVFIDDFSKMTWVYLLKSRTQVVDVVKKKFNEIKTRIDSTQQGSQTSE